MPFAPPVATPLVPGQDGKYYFILGVPSSIPSSAAAYTTVPAKTAATDYSTSGTTFGQFTGGSGQTSLAEPVTVYATRDGSTGSAVTGTRTTTVALSPLNDANAATNSLMIVQFTVTVAYTYRGQSYSYSMYTMRGPD